MSGSAEVMAVVVVVVVVAVVNWRHSQLKLKGGTPSKCVAFNQTIDTQQGSFTLSSSDGTATLVRSFTDVNFSVFNSGMGSAQETRKVIFSYFFFFSLSFFFSSSPNNAQVSMKPYCYLPPPPHTCTTPRKQAGQWTDYRSHVS